MVAHPTKLGLSTGHSTVVMTVLSFPAAQLIRTHCINEWIHDHQDIKIINLTNLKKENFFMPCSMLLCKMWWLESRKGSLKFTGMTEAIYIYIFFKEGRWLFCAYREVNKLQNKPTGIKNHRRSSKMFLISFAMLISL